MCYILNIETSTKNCSVTLAFNGEIKSSREVADLGYSHAEKLHVFIEEVLNEKGLKISDLNAVAISMGPGSYTGLRIGVAAAKGLCYAADIPLIALDTLEILARQTKVADGVIMPMIDARRMEVYTATFDKDYNKITPTQAIVVTEEFYKSATDNVTLIGDGAAKCMPFLKEAQFIVQTEIIYPSALQMGKLSFEKYTNNDFVDIAYFEPNYLKEFYSNK
ncbi:tRNA (adenosine(37)-N6)-threonylcarbamoyltransferase complex dimerization subunit type 1 TsaB [Flavobacterium orientale]|uniref:tRNA (Adenosine(37)-N6)-threonylcarbamoyltransferase complex dimerization subunit type 1 TsaB n=1 Tax=Flavobacterium orientale TaxID=1756020 RepID=A0A917DFT2_9FLAO|nr:tRNA (adenosine(37)-N6)-threonylcarbamoyltransferase complex dimerization subunit type 1 TsaB [Flavobacterium orientale]GGD33572.1 tRNA (adenosine(37)-N6)-threonylcarbamoyltransferase complex dimerization subunit type 1 TsaB [Flavobacterium orientale]